MVPAWPCAFNQRREPSTCRLNHVISGLQSWLRRMFPVAARHAAQRSMTPGNTPNRNGDPSRNHSLIASGSQVDRNRIATGSQVDRKRIATQSQPDRRIHIPNVPHPCHHVVVLGSQPDRGRIAAGSRRSQSLNHMDRNHFARITDRSHVVHRHYKCDFVIGTRCG